MNAETLQLLLQAGGAVGVCAMFLYFTQHENDKRDKRDNQRDQLIGEMHDKFTSTISKLSTDATENQKKLAEKIKELGKMINEQTKIISTLRVSSENQTKVIQSMYVHNKGQADKIREYEKILNTKGESK